MTRYAVNICDCTYDEVRFMAGLMLTPVTPNRTTVETERGRVDGGAVVLECEEERAKAICQVLQKKPIRTCGQGGRKVRCYIERPRGGWKRFGAGKMAYEKKPEEE